MYILYLFATKRSLILSVFRGVLSYIRVVTIRIITCYSPYSPYLHPLVLALDSFLASCNPFSFALLYRSLLVYIKLLLLVTLAFFFNLESSLVNSILPTEPYLLVAFYLKGRDIILSSSLPLPSLY
jgi:hypothetical protein